MVRLAKVHDEAKSAGDTGHTFAVSDTVEFIDALKDVRQSGGWLPLGLHLSCAGNANNNFSTRFGIYLIAYMNAYLRNGEFGTANVTIDPSKIIPDYKDLPASLQGAITEAATHTWGKVGTAAFVDRFGDSYQLEALSLQVQNSAAKNWPTASLGNFNYVSAEVGLIRVLIEAYFDAVDQLPAVPNATGTITGLTTELRKAGITPPANLGELSLPIFDPTSAPAHPTDINETQFNELVKLANLSEVGTTSAVSLIVRSAPFIKGDEAVDQLVETAVGVTARKVSEKIGWCTFQTVNSVNAATQQQRQAANPPL
jgi:hypothetical protein